MTGGEVVLSIILGCFNHVFCQFVYNWLSASQQGNRCDTPNRMGKVYREIRAIN